MEQRNNISPAIAALIVVVLVGISTAAVATINKADPEPTSQHEPAPSSQRSNSTPSDNSYRDGTYTSQGSYITPGGRESIGLTVTLKDGVIEDVDLEQQASGGDTVAYQRKFASGYKGLVVGKSIDEVELNHVAGSSLTSNGFNDALEQIKTDAAS